MKIEHRTVTVAELVKGYTDNDEGGVSGYSGRLDIRPPYQREFVYKDKQRAAVITTVMKGFPLNVMYWANREDGTYEIMDGQQRTISLGQFATGEFSVDLGNGPKYFDNLTSDERERFNNYELLVYVCEGSDSDKLNWFKTINIAGERLTEQEMRNAVYHGPWLSDAKRWFSRRGGAAVQFSENYLRGDPVRQDLLETALKWACLRSGLTDIEDYMAKHQNRPNATELWSHFQNVLTWAKSTFPNEERKELRQVKWGELYQEFGHEFYDGTKLEQRVKSLMEDPDVTNKVGIYTYVLDGQERHLSIRAFDDNQRREAFERQQRRCANSDRCKTPGNSNGTKEFKLSEMQADHITPWSKGGRTITENCQMLCAPCNRQKSDK